MDSPFARIAYPDEPRQAPQPSERVEHVTSVEEASGTRLMFPFRALCSCGFVGIWHLTKERAQAVADKHVKVKGGRP